MTRHQALQLAEDLAHRHHGTYRVWLCKDGMFVVLNAKQPPKAMAVLTDSVTYENGVVVVGRHAG